MTGKIDAQHFSAVNIRFCIEIHLKLFTNILNCWRDILNVRTLKSSSENTTVIIVDCYEHNLKFDISLTIPIFSRFRYSSQWIWIYFWAFLSILNGFLWYKNSSEDDFRLFFFIHRTLFKNHKIKKPSAIGTVAMYLLIRHTTSSCVFYFSVWHLFYVNTWHFKNKQFFALI